jgi:hypothetical protein
VIPDNHEGRLRGFHEGHEGRKPDLLFVVIVHVGEADLRGL